jgi:single-stranded-DNA-specific exonuclease
LTLKTRLSTRPCPFRTSELLRQDGVHPVLARIYASRGLLDARELSSELAALSPPSVPG